MATHTSPAGGPTRSRCTWCFWGRSRRTGTWDEGISGPWRFLDKVWALVGEACRTHAGDEVRHETLVK